MKIQLTASKQLQIDRDQSAALIAVAVAVVVSVFCLVSAKQLWSQASYQRHVVNGKHQAVTTLNNDINAAADLTNRYNTIFQNNATTVNIIGGRNVSCAKAVPPDGSNDCIVLDALPTTYDFPALISSLTQILNNDGITNPGISGTDQSSTANNTPSSSPAPIPIQLTISGNGAIGQVKSLISDLERSIRPFNVTNLQLRGSDANMSISMNVTTYYQPALVLTIGSRTVQ